ncbi:MAG: ribonuclease Y [Gemmatimonadetes bacterium HGW-Gemmatimonadetes-1]|jgi:ribonuclease Y|nr:MAG: ribonuclease Y [Gemmatimonadetes bacterium HGW-Gemmatimonadetes-1]
MEPNVLAALGGGVVLGAAIGAVILNLVLASRGRDARGLVATAERESAGLLAAAERDALATRERQVEAARIEAATIRDAASEEATRRRSEVERIEQRLSDRDQQLAGREAQLVERERRLHADEGSLAERHQQLTRQATELAASEAAVLAARQEINQRLEQVAGMTAEAAAREIRQQVEDAARTEGAALAREIREQARREADKDARRLIAMASQRLAAEHTAETTVAAVALPNDEMKGRIIGREGRNIRAFELATGVDVIIDDTPDTVVVSCFDPIRREVARRALEALVIDGRIHPGRIEEIVVKMQGELQAQLVELGERAAYDLGVHGLHPELVKLIGRMRYRSSYGQNLYEHSKEVAWLAGMMAAELQADVMLAKRGGLLHDIGKVLTHEHEGTHVQLGVEMARRYGESAAVINAIEAHHDDVPHEHTESVLVQAADAISGSRPGARREAFESYVKRLVKLEQIAAEYPGVDKTTVIQAGREIRVIVRPEEVDDAAAHALAESVARRIEQELQYPGQIRVTVIRETRATEVAK